jgi:coproporphyrinogen III oxidase-like Fe-S oxidoreductase
LADYYRDISEEKIIFQLLSAADRLMEWCLNAFRLLQEGFSAEAFERRTGLAFSHLSPYLGEFIWQGWMEYHATHACYRLTPRGACFLDNLQEHIAVHLT